MSKSSSPHSLSNNPSPIFKNSTPTLASSVFKVTNGLLVFAQAAEENNKKLTPRRDAQIQREAHSRCGDTDRAAELNTQMDILTRSFKLTVNSGI